MNLDLEGDNGTGRNLKSVEVILCLQFYTFILFLQCGSVFGLRIRIHKGPDTKIHFESRSIIINNTVRNWSFRRRTEKKHFPGHCLGTGTKYLLRLKSRIFLVTLSLYYVIVVLRFKLNKNIHIQKTKNLVFCIGTGIYLTSCNK